MAGEVADIIRADLSTAGRVLNLAGVGLGGRFIVSATVSNSKVGSASAKP